MTPNQRLEVKTKAKVKQPNYFKMGNGTLNRHGIESINLITEMVSLKKPAQHMLAYLLNHMQWNQLDKRVEFIVKVIGKDSAGKKEIQRAYKELKERNLVRRIKRGHYMVNPNAVNVDYEEQMKIWNWIEEEN